MATATIVSLEEYLSTNYDPDCDFVDGILDDRVLGQQEHSDLQTELAYWFRLHRNKYKVKALVEQRLRINNTKFRVPDLCVFQLPAPTEPIPGEPPFICVEVLSPDDTISRMQTRFDDYLDFGVPNIWVIDPSTRRAWTISRLGHFECLNGILATTDGSIELPLADLFS